MWVCVEGVCVCASVWRECVYVLVCGGVCVCASVWRECVYVLVCGGSVCMC